MTQPRSGSDQSDSQAPDRDLNVRVQRLEMQLAHAQRLCEQLNEVVTQLSLDVQKRNRTIDALIKQTKDLKAKMEFVGEAAPDEKPPHY